MAIQTLELKAALAKLKHPELAAWVAEIAELTQPANLYIADGS